MCVCDTISLVVEPIRINKQPTMERVVHGASCPWGELSVGRTVRGANCPWGELSVGRTVHGASCPWGELYVGRAVHGANCPWGELSMGRVVVGRVSMGRVVREPIKHKTGILGVFLDPSGISLGLTRNPTGF